MTPMDDLVQFLRARLNEDEQTARAAGDSWYGYEPEQQIAFVSVEDARHIARHGPARALREVEAKRQLLTEYKESAASLAAASAPDMYDVGRLQGLEIAVRATSLPYADHPDYRGDWRP
ncbi:DUF6221 family protein [Streptomyces sp. NBC_01022]|uniref:DUF6221 family protein n=1 Tax=Streptomyces sp. NBC_01022 TaxID=2903723 RepID=UPI002DDC49B2|nr:DUF6221 family protein [Streptomyces sp. NBC_01022]WRZ84841.1 DUF6221 family protein [Streptomyces sp. NBC_01022]